MKYFSLVWAALWRKPLRTVLTTLALVMAFTVVGLMESIDAGLSLLRDNARMDKVFVFSRFGAPLPMAYKEQIAQIPGVKRVIGQIGIGGTINGDPKRQAFIGASEDGFFEFNSQFDITPAQIAELRGKRNAFVISALNAKNWGLKVGDRMILNSMPKADGTRDWAFDLVAIVDIPNLPGIAGVSVGNYEYVNEERTAGKDMVGQFMVILDSNDPAVAVAASRTIEERFLNSPAPVRTQSEGMSAEQQYDDNNLPEMVNAIIGAALFALLLLTFNSLMQSFRERIPELGTLKAIGFNDRQVLGLVVAEALLQCMIGAVIGLAIARALIPYAKTLLVGQGTQFMTFSWSVAVVGILAACLVALLSAAIPAWRAARMEIVNALAAR